MDYFVDVSIVMVVSTYTSRHVYPESLLIATKSLTRVTSPVALSRKTMLLF